MKLVEIMMNVIKLTSIKYSWSKYFPSYKIILIIQNQNCCFSRWTKIIYLSALENRNIRKLLFTIKGLVSNLHKEYRPSKLTKILNDACNKHPVKNNRNRLIKLKFAKQNKSSDLSISIHGNQTDKIPDSYRKYLVNYFSDQLGLSGVPIRLIFKKEKNPFDMGSNSK